MYANSDEAIVYDGKPAGPTVDADLLGFGPAYRLYEAAEGWVMLACACRSEWEALCGAIERPDLAEHWRSASPDLACQLADTFRQRTGIEWEALAVERDIPLVAVEMRDPGRFNMNDDEMRRLGHAVQTTSPVHGEYWRHGALQTFSDATQTFGPWDPLGGHTASILRELGYSYPDIGRLNAEKVVEVWEPETS
jgi:crotonobetainyl-CoA:carnitine CoA-transferase CaiB-like acyl-CoA transferase